MNDLHSLLHRTTIMRWNKKNFRFQYLLLLLFLLPLQDCVESAPNVKDVFNLNSPINARVPRDNKYYSSNRYGSSSSNPSPLNRVIKPEDSPEAQEATPVPVEKRCTRCGDTLDWRYPYESRSRYDDRRYRDRYDDRYDDRRDDKRYDRYDRYEDRDRDRYDRYRPDYYDRDRYSDRDRGYDRDSGYDREFNRDRGSIYDRDRGSGYDRDRGSGYDRDRYYYDRYNDRGVGYDNRGYDYRERGYDRDGYRPWDETYRGTSGFDNTGRGYYFATGRPEVGSSGYWGGGAGGGYASSWNYGGGGSGGTGGRDDYRDRYGGGTYRPRDTYDGYRSTSYLYGRPSSTTTNRPDSNSVSSDSGATQSPQQDNSSG